MSTLTETSIGSPIDTEDTNLNFGEGDLALGGEADASTGETLLDKAEQDGGAFATSLTVIDVDTQAILDRLNAEHERAMQDAANGPVEI